MRPALHNARTRHRQRSGVIVGILFVGLLGALGVQLWIHVTQTSPTWDEPVHILAGARYWHCGDFTLNPEHPPLLKLAATVPLLGRQLAEPDWPCGSRVASVREAEYAAAQFLARNGIDAIVTRTRLAAAAPTLALALLVFWFARRTFGSGTALTAVALMAFEPTLLAHGSLVTTDMALTFALFAAVCAIYRYGSCPTRPRLLMVGLAAGALVAVKHSALLLLPILLLLVCADTLVIRRRPQSGKVEPSGVGRIGAAGLAMFVGGLAILWSVYGFRYYALPGNTHETLSVAALQGESPPGLAQRLVAVAHRARVVPESYTYGLAYVIASGSRPMYLFGTVYPSGRWFYFPVAFAIKSSIALLLLLPIALALPGLYRRAPRAMLFLLLPSLAYFGLALTSGLNIGVRHLLPVYPFFMIVAAAGACHLARRLRVLRFAVSGLLLVHAGTAVHAAPDYLAFSNALWGGTRHTYRWLNDSNADWGQNLKRVDAYREAHGIRDCWFAALGMADLVRPYRACRKLPAPGWAISGDLVDVVPPVIDGTVFLSIGVLPPWGGPEYAPIVATPPADVVGGGVLVFRGRFEVPLAAALSHAARAEQWIGWGRFGDALQEARAAVHLGPDDWRTHWQLAAAYAANGMADDARRALDTANRLAADSASPPTGDAKAR